MNKKMNRKDAREAALQSLFAAEFQPGEVQLTIPRDEETGVNGFHLDENYKNEIIAGVRNNIKALDEHIQKYLKKWQIQRLDVVDRNILRLSVWELMYANNNLASSIIINEAVEMAKKYGTEVSYKLINGVLDNLVKNEKLSNNG